MSDEDIAKAVYDALSEAAFYAYINPFEMPPETIDEFYDSIEGYGVTVDGSFNFRAMAEKIRRRIVDAARNSGLEEAAKVAEDFETVAPMAYVDRLSIADAIRKLKT